MALAQNLIAGSSMAQIVVMCWLAWKITHIDATLTGIVRAHEKTARRVAHISGKMGLDEFDE